MTSKSDHFSDYIKTFLEAAEAIAKKTGGIAREESKRYRDSSSVSSKLSSSDLVTETDQKIEGIIIKSLSESFPTHKFIGEETADGPCILTDEPTWIIDPIDGTCNFVHGFPCSAIVLGLAIDKEVVVGVIYNFFTDELYSAMKGGGAYINGQPLHVSNCTDIKKALVITDVGGTRTAPELDPKVSTIHDLASEKCHVHGIRSLGSAAISCCMVARGCADAYVEYGIHCWDFAAGSVIIREAGGVVLSPDGSPMDLMCRGVLVASCQELADSMLPFIHHCNYTRDDDPTQ